MTGYAAQARPASSLRSLGVTREEQWAAPDVRRKLQLALAGIWLLDAILQFQVFMFSKGFAQMLAGTGPGNPGFIASPISWAARIISEHGTATNAVFALIQLLLGLGIALRPTTRIALGASIGWALAVWWFGEGLGRPERHREPSQRRSGCGDHLRPARGVVVATAAGERGVLRGGPVRRACRRQDAMAGAVGQSCVHGFAASHEGTEGTQQHDLRNGGWAAFLAGQRRQPPG